MEINELYKKIMKDFDMEEKKPVPYIVGTGSSLLDRALGIKGYPAGRIIEIYGPEGTGKTTLGLHAMAEAQKKGLLTAIVDMECAFDQSYAETIGLHGERNVDYLHVIPDYGEQAIDVIASLIDNNINLIIVDSVAAMTPKAEYEGETGDAFIGLQARMMGQALRKLTNRVYESSCILIFINQVRSKVGVFFGSSETTTGGRALKFYSSIRLEVRPGEQIKKGTNVIGKFAKVKIAKNKLAPPLKVVHIPIIFGDGINRGYELFDILIVEGIIKKKSSYFYYADEKIGFGKDETVKYIINNTDKFLKILEDKYK